MLCSEKDLSVTIKCNREDMNKISLKNRIIIIMIILLRKFVQLNKFNS